MDDSPEAHGIATAGAAKALHEVEAELWADPENQRLWEIRQELLAEIDEHQRRMQELSVSSRMDQRRHGAVCERQPWGTGPTVRHVHPTHGPTGERADLDTPASAQE